MQANKIRIEKIAPCDLSVSYSEISVDSPFNDEHSHIHGECEIYLNLSGDVSFEVENRLYPIKRGSVIITRPYEHHHCIYHSDLPHGHYYSWRKRN